MAAPPPPPASQPAQELAELAAAWQQELGGVECKVNVIYCPNGNSCGRVVEQLWNIGKKSGNSCGMHCNVV